MAYLNTLNDYQNMLGKLQRLNFKKIKIDYDLPHDYVVSKFFELGYYPKYNAYNETYQCCCPMCREGESFGLSKRCYYLPDKNLIYCHNCGWSSKPYKWVKTLTGFSDQEIQNEVEEGDFDILENLDFTNVKKTVVSGSLPDDSINLSDPSQLEFYKNDKRVTDALQYIKNRKLDTAVNRPDTYYISLKDKIHKNRLILPFKDDKGKIVFYQSRKLFGWDDKANYISKLGCEKTVCGLDKISSDIDSIFLFEGPIDSFFVRNGVGIGGITKGHQIYTETQKQQLDRLMFFDKIWVLDSQWIDKTSRQKTKNLIESGEKVFFWPEKYGNTYKDINEMCVAFNLNEISPTFIKENSFSGREAILKYSLMFSR